MLIYKNKISVKLLAICEASLPGKFLWSLKSIVSQLYLFYHSFQMNGSESQLYALCQCDSSWYQGDI